METKQLSDITIENMLENIFRTYSIKKKRKDIVSYYAQILVTDFFGSQSPDGETVTEEDVKKRVDSILTEDKKSTDPYLRYSNGTFYKARRKAKPIDPTDKPDSNYTGKAGECAVMAELLFRGYNVNNMMVDEGIDLVASKDNVFFYIQVKTKHVDEQNRFYFQIKQERFDSFVGTQTRYILVARCKLDNQDRNIYFKFSNDDIQRFQHVGVIPVPSENSEYLSIKIEFDPRTGKAYLYDTRNREDVSFYMNNFKL